MARTDGECGGDGPYRRARAVGVREDKSRGVSGDLGRLIFDNRPCRNVPRESVVTTELRRSSSGRRVDVDPGVTILSWTESGISGGGGVTLRVRGRFNFLVCIGGDRTGVRGVAFLLLLGVSSLELVLLARLAALSSDDLAASNRLQALSSSGSLMAAGGVSARLD
jgi:hypothetical protein